MERAQVALVLLAFLALLAQPAAAQIRRKPGECICMDVYAPVCGANGVTYSNSCQASCAGVAVVSQGECGTNGGTMRKLHGSCLCTMVYKPVCGADGVTYGNACEAKCAKVAVVSQGACGTDGGTMRKLHGSCLCTMVYKPVCGADGVTYGNACEAKCAKVAVVSNGPCDGSGGYASARKMLQTAATQPAQTTTPTIIPEGCFCPAVYIPVCGADGKTYGNSCEAGCAKVPVVSDGECPPPSCICTKEYNPQCGSDGKTYGNPCEAECAKVTYTPGECGATGGCVCALIYDPVCGADGVTYGNPCQAACAKVAVVSKGECVPPITCQPTDPGVRCFADPCGLPSPCKGQKGLSCQSNYCGRPTTYLGQTISEPCSAVYVDIASQKIVDCAPASPPKDPCASISKTYNPVCGADGRTYHNRAAATCQKVVVLHAGACALCPATTPACPTTGSSPVCCSDGKTYCSACTAKALKKTIVYRGRCGPSKCLAEGAVCLLSNSKCCRGTSCNGGPVLREGQIFGTCIVGTGPRG